MTNSPFENEIRENIERDGRFIMGVGATEPGDQWFYYTVGNHCRGLPELLMIGPSNRGVGGVLDDLSEAMIKQGRAFSDGETVSLGGKFPVRRSSLPTSTRQTGTTRSKRARISKSLTM